MSQKIMIDKFTGLAEPRDEGWMPPPPPPRFCAECKRKLAHLNRGTRCFACQDKFKAEFLKSALL